ncbi:hypothetical protein FQA39_LY00318 [Lamprigera yunnana]|nr:hypothetical protein FQA39_LY00318 [Lamprigera yunnana]
MKNTVQNFINSFARTYRKNFKSTLIRHWYGTENTSGTSEEMIQNILKEKFPTAINISVEDVSGGCGAMYKIFVESDTFKGLSVAKQHKTVYAALDSEIKLIHGLHLQTKVPP